MGVLPSYPSLHQPLGPVSIRRRSAAQGCANAHPDRGPPEGRWVCQAEIGLGHDTGACWRLNPDKLDVLYSFQRQLTPNNQWVQDE